MKRYSLIPAGDLLVPVSTKRTSPADFAAAAVGLDDSIWTVALTFYVKGGNAGCALAVVFVFVTWDSLREMWDTVPYLTYEVTAVGTAAVQETINLETCPEKLKLLSIQNQESSAGYTIVANVSCFVK
jgi:hypothetical protein